MLDHVLNEVLLAHLKAEPALAALNGYTGQDNAEHKLPALTISTTSEPLAGSDTAFRGEVSIAIESEAHDTTPAIHGERVEAVRSVLSDRRSGHRSTQCDRAFAHLRLRAARFGTHGGRCSFHHEPALPLRLRAGVSVDSTSRACPPTT